MPVSSIAVKRLAREVETRVRRGMSFDAALAEVEARTLAWTGFRRLRSTRVQAVANIANCVFGIDEEDLHNAVKAGLISQDRYEKLRALLQ